MRVSQIPVVCALFAGCRSDRAPAPRGTVARRDDRTAAAAAAQRLAGCYVLEADHSPSYHLRLDAGGEAHRTGPGATANVAGDRWEWSARTESTFVVAWSGIDSWMEFDVVSRDGKWIADGVLRTVGGQQHLPARVERVGCPAPGA